MKSRTIFMVKDVGAYAYAGTDVVYSLTIVEFVSV